MVSNSEIGDYLNKNKHSLAAKFTDLFLDNSNKFNFTPNEIYETALADLNKLFISIISDRKNIFKKYIKWKKSVYLNREYPLNEIKRHIELLAYIIKIEAPSNYADTIFDLIMESINDLNENLVESTHLDISNPNYHISYKYLNYLLEGKEKEADKLISESLNKGMKIDELYSDIFKPVQYEIGRKWQLNQISVADEHLATNITLSILNKISYLFNDIPEENKSILTASVGNEYHIIGIRFVNDMFRLKGWKTYFLGSGAPNNEILSAVQKYEPDFVALSATMDIYLYILKNLIINIKDIKKDTKVIVGGNVFNHDSSLLEYVEADYFAESAEKGIDICEAAIKGM